MLKIISVSGSLSQITKLWVNLNSAIFKCRAVIPKAVISVPSAVLSLALVGCKGVLNCPQCFDKQSIGVMRQLLL